MFEIRVRWIYFRRTVAWLAALRLFLCTFAYFYFSFLESIRGNQRSNWSIWVRTHTATHYWKIKNNVCNSFIEEIKCFWALSQNRQFHRATRQEEIINSHIDHPLHETQTYLLRLVEFLPIFAAGCWLLLLAVFLLLLNRNHKKARRWKSVTNSFWIFIRYVFRFLLCGASVRVCAKLKSFSALDSCIHTEWARTLFYTSCGTRKK